MTGFWNPTGCTSSASPPTPPAPGDCKTQQASQPAQWKLDNAGRRFRLLGRDRDAKSSPPGSVALTDGEAQAGWADVAPSRCLSASVQLRRVPVPTGGDHLAVRWYLRYGLSYRDVEDLLAERGITVDHVTIYRWGQRFTPELIDAARPSRHVAGDRWFVDETYLKVAGRWVYLYRAIDQYGQVIDVLASPKRDLAATRRFFARELNARGGRPRSRPTGRRPTRGYSTSWFPRRVTWWSSTPTTRSKPITAG